jgi:type VI secretion system secreted protein VgrG
MAFRSARCVTPRPVIQGMQTAVVACPSGEEVETDAYGRVKVRFHWEREEKSSCWVRVGQVWAGAGFGAMFIPRRRQEVLVNFLEGDPDRPVIVGSLYHATNVVPYLLPAGKTQSGIKSNSSPGGEGANELRFEDKKGSEAIYLHAQKDLAVRVEHDEALEVKNERRVNVGANERLSVEGERVTEVKGSETEKVGGEKKSEVGESLTEEIEGDLSLAVGGDRAEHVMGESRVLVDGTYKLTVKGATLELACGSVKIKIGPAGVAIEGGMLTVNGHPPMLL